ncbi:Uncharacterized protein Fot_30711 [Forsythia ovata]|uniref:Uncharacterized protein n=1 Tax=Forsythia ovata TaxID=205694 RepID=A0ABD1T2W5_9LAMI
MEKLLYTLGALSCMKDTYICYFLQEVKKVEEKSNFAGLKRGPLGLEIYVLDSQKFGHNRGNVDAILWWLKSREKIRVLGAERETFGDWNLIIFMAKKTDGGRT